MHNYVQTFSIRSCRLLQACVREWQVCTIFFKLLVWALRDTLFTNTNNKHKTKKTMKKNFLRGLLTIMMVALMSMNFVSCSDDDDDKKDSNNGSNTETIIGTWRCSGDGESSEITFYPDGRGLETYIEKGVTDTESFTYSYDTDKKTLRIFYSYGDSDSAIVTINSNRMVITWSYDGSSEVYVRVK